MTGSMQLHGVKSVHLGPASLLRLKNEKGEEYGEPYARRELRILTDGDWFSVTLFAEDGYVAGEGRKVDGPTQLASLDFKAEK